jgi:aerobic carbon-monoxide dehydrogenase medium subunit
MRFRGRRDVIRLGARVNRESGVSMAAATTALETGVEVLQPGSEEEAIEAFGDGAGVTVLAGGTIVVPEMTYGYLKPQRVLMLAAAGLVGVSRNGSRTTIGAMTSVQDLVDLPAPLGPCAANVADLEIRSQGTAGGNLCAPQGRDAPRGDLQAAFLALDAQVRSAGAGGERTEAVEDFRANADGRLVLDISFEEPAAGGFARLDRPHTHDYSALTVCAARAADGTIRIALAGVDGPAVRLPSAEAKADDPAAAAEAANADATFADDALASAWYRERTLPVLVRRALTKLQEDA